MRKTIERSRVLVAVRSPRENRISIALVALALALAVLVIILAPRLARAETAALDGFVPSVIEFGSEPAPAGSYYFPDMAKYGGPGLGWRLAPANSTTVVGEGFPQTTAKVKCTVTVTTGVVTIACPGLERELKGRFVGVTGLTTWRETVAGAPEPVTKLGVFLYLQTLTVAGHVYHSSVAASPKGHANEVVLQVEPRGSAQAKDVEVQFVHQDVAAAASLPLVAPGKAAKKP